MDRFAKKILNDMLPLEERPAGAQSGCNQDGPNSSLDLNSTETWVDSATEIFGRKPASPASEVPLNDRVTSQLPFTNWSPAKREPVITPDELTTLKSPPEYITNFQGEKCFPMFPEYISQYWRCHNFYTPPRQASYIMLTLIDLGQLTTGAMAIWMLAEYGWQNIDAALQEYRARLRLSEKIGKPLNFILVELFRNHYPKTSPPYDLSEIGTFLRH